MPQTGGTNQIKTVKYLKEVACVEISENITYIKHLYVDFWEHQKQAGKQISPWRLTRCWQVLESKAETRAVGLKCHKSEFVQ